MIYPYFIKLYTMGTSAGAYTKESHYILLQSFLSK